MRQTLREFLGLIEPEMLYTDDGRSLLRFLKTHPDFDGKNAQPVKDLADYIDNIFPIILSEAFVN
jgi:hypothetical protein